MIKTLKWIYKLGATHRESQILDQLTGAARYHRQQAELAFYRTGAKPNGIAVQPPTTQLKGVAKRKRAKDGVQNTSRYSFEITADLKAKLERAVLEHQLNTGKKVSTSAVIRTAIEKYLKTGKL